MKAIISLALLLSLPLSIAAEDSASARTLDQAFSRSTLQIATADGRLHAFKVWIADNDARRTRGLMHVRELKDDEGMLFLYPRTQRISMWMKNTFIPLDMLFIRADGRIATIVENATPQSLETIDSGEPVAAVLEVKGGRSAALGIRRGDQVIHPAFPR